AEMEDPIGELARLADTDNAFYQQVMHALQLGMPPHAVMEVLHGVEARPEVRAPGAEMDFARTATPDAGFDARPTAQRALERAREGTPTDVPHREALEALLGEDLGGVRAFIGPEAADATEMVDAEAFAVGDTVVFGDAAPELGVVAEEVAHALQQGTQPVNSVRAIADPRSDIEAEAKRALQPQLVVERLLEWRFERTVRVWSHGAPEASRMPQRARAQAL